MSPWFDKTGSSAVDNDVAGIGLALDCVRREAAAVVYVEYLNLLIGHDVGGVHQGGVKCDGAFVVDVRAGDSGAVDFALKHCPHRVLLDRTAGIKKPFR
jgi:hypothetical protein